MIIFEIIIPIAIVIVILSVILWILYKQNKEIYKKLLDEKNRYLSYKKEIQNLYQKTSQNLKEDFNNIDNIARRFFKEYYNLKPSLTYLELAEIFKKQNKKLYVKFCELMSRKKYSGEMLSKEEKEELLKLFDKIIDDYYS